MSNIKRLLDDMEVDYENGMTKEEIRQKYNVPMRMVDDMITLYCEELLEEEIVVLEVNIED